MNLVDVISALRGVRSQFSAGVLWSGAGWLAWNGPFGQMAEPMFDMDPFVSMIRLMPEALAWPLACLTIYALGVITPALEVAFFVTVFGGFLAAISWFLVDRIAWSVPGWLSGLIAISMFVASVVFTSTHRELWGDSWRQALSRLQQVSGRCAYWGDHVRMGLRRLSGSWFFRKRWADPIDEYVHELHNFEIYRACLSESFVEKLIDGLDRRTLHFFAFKEVSFPDDDPTRLGPVGRKAGSWAEWRRLIRLLNPTEADVEDSSLRQIIVSRFTGDRDSARDVVKRYVGLARAQRWERAARVRDACASLKAAKPDSFDIFDKSCAEAELRQLFALPLAFCTVALVGFVKWGSLQAQVMVSGALFIFVYGSFRFLASRSLRTANGWLVNNIRAGEVALRSEVVDSLQFLFIRCDVVVHVASMAERPRADVVAGAPTMPPQSPIRADQGRDDFEPIE